MSLGGACYGDGELVAELLTDELDKLGGVMQVAAGAGPAEGEVAAQGEHMVDAVVKVGLELLLDAFLGIADAGEVGHAGALAVLDDLVEDFKVLADIRAARAVGAGDVVGIQGVELLQHAALAAELFHADIGLRGEHFKGKRVAMFHDFSNIHDKLPPNDVFLCRCGYGSCRNSAHSDTNLSYHTKTGNASAFLPKYYFAPLKNCAG